MSCCFINLLEQFWFWLAIKNIPKTEESIIRDLEKIV